MDSSEKDVYEQLASLRREVKTLRKRRVKQLEKLLAPSLYEHILYVTIFAAIAAVFSLALPTMDATTLKPAPGRMPRWLIDLSRATNWPIKVGLFHAIFYFIEWRNPRTRSENLAQHVGQRATTLFIQCLQNPRWGQHLAMQLETCLQAGENLVHASTLELLFFLVAAATMLLQLAVTSSGYHTFEEQMLGLLSGIIKSVLIDRSVHIARQVNGFIGGPFTSARNVYAACVCLCAVLAYSEQRPGPEMVVAVLCFAACTAKYLPLLANPSRLRSDVYDAAILSMTRLWYEVILAKLSQGARVLDIGIGTASALCVAENADAVEERI